MARISASSRGPLACIFKALFERLGWLVAAVVTVALKVGAYHFTGSVGLFSDAAPLPLPDEKCPTLERRFFGLQ